MLALPERHVGDFAEAGEIVFQRADMAPVHLLRAVAEVVGAVAINRASMASISILAAMKASSAATLVMGMMVPEFVART